MAGLPPISELRFKQILSRAIALPLILMGVLAIVLLFQIARLISLTEWVEHTDEVIGSTNSVHQLLLSRVSGLRGFLLTGRPRLLDPFRTAKVELPDRLLNLGRLVKDNPTQVMRVNDIRGHYDRWCQFAQGGIDMRKAGGDVSEYVGSGKGQMELDAITAALAAMVRAEERLRTERTAAVRAASGRIAWSGVALTVLLGGLLAYQSRRHLIEVTRSYLKALSAAEQRAAALQQSELSFRSLADSKLIGLVSFDIGGPLLAANETFQRLVGYTPDDLVSGLPWIDLIPPDLRDNWTETIAQFRATGIWAPAMQEMVCKDGRRVSVWLGGTLVEGYSDRALCFAIDTTERRRAEESLRFLADAAALLAASLDFGAPLRKVADLAVPFAADWCVIDVLDEDESLRRVAGAHVDAAKEGLVFELSRRYPPGPGEADPLMALVRSGRPEFYPRVSDSVLAAAAHDPEHLAMLRELGFGSSICVPLVARGRTFGAITLVMGESGRVYDEHDVALAEDLARRIAVAIDNARLYQGAQKEIKDRRKAEEALEAHRAEIEALNDHLRRAMTETHHRVKNNLQIIAAMVDMRLMDHKDAIPVEEFRRLGSVVSTLAAVHQILTHEAKDDGQAHHISAAEVLEKLIPLLQRTAGDRPIRLEVQDMRLSARQGTSLALVVNELVSNAIKYGKHQVDVALCITDGTAILEVIDDGAGFPPGFDATRDGSTGLELVERLSRWDLAGKPRYENRPGGGARASVAFPLVECGPV